MKRGKAFLGILAFLITACWSVRLSALGSTDFHAFYCGGAALTIGADPYRVEPLRACERGEENIHAPSPGSGPALPVPLPGYDLAAFAVLAHLPYPAAALVWQTLLWSCVALTIILLTRLTALPFPIVGAAILFSDGYIASFLGQLTPVACLGLALAAWGATRRRRWITAVGAGLAMCEPHVGVGTFLAVLLWLPDARPAMVFCLSALGALTYAATGFTRTWEYLREVVPLHALSEVSHEGQYSLTYLLHLGGMDAHAALRIGMLCYVILLGVGLIVARRLQLLLRDDALPVLIPPAFTLLGGPFIHLAQIAAVAPAALLLHDRLPGQRRPLAAAIALLAIPWGAFVELQAIMPLVALTMLLLARHAVGGIRIPAALTLAQCAALIIPAALLDFPKIDGRIFVDPNALSEVSWMPAVQALYTHHVAFFLPLKIPTWCGQILTVRAAMLSISKPRR